MRTMDSRDETLAVGRLKKPFGREGALHFESYSGEIDHLVGVSVCIQPSGRPARVISCRPHGKSFVIQLDISSSIEEAQALVGAELGADRAHAAPLSENEYYIRDLVGLELQFSGDVIGRVESVWSTGASDYLEVRGPTGAIHQVPFLQRFVSSPEGGVIRILDPSILE